MIDIPDYLKSIVASQIRSSIEVSFAHWQGVPELDFEAEFTRWVEEIHRLSDRRSFSLSTSAFMAKFANGHTGFHDSWLWRTQGQTLGLNARPLGDDWVVIASDNPAVPIGQTIKALSGVPVWSCFDEASRYISASSKRAAACLYFSRPYLFAPKFDITLGDGSLVSVARTEFPRATSGRPELALHRENGAAVLRVPSFDQENYEKEAVELVAQVPPNTALVIDVRGNGGGNTPIELMSTLMDRPFRFWREETPVQTGLDYAYGSRPASKVIGPETFNPGPDAFEGKLAILIDSRTFSAAEDFVMPFKDNNRALLVGETTAGSSGQPFYKDFGNGMILLVGAKRQYFPDGSDFEGVGVVPDVAVEVTGADIAAGTDRPLLAAISLLADSSSVRAASHSAQE